MMRAEDITAAAEREGFAKAVKIKTGNLVFQHEFRMFCEQNACGNFGKNYGCPPYCGTPEEMEARVKKYNTAIVFQSRTPVEDIFNDSETKAIKKEHTRKTFAAVDMLQKQGLSKDGLYIMCGACNLCECCGMSRQKPCTDERRRFSCLSAYCIDASQMAKDCHMDMEWNGDVVSFFSLYVYNEN